MKIRIRFADDRYLLSPKNALAIEALLVGYSSARQSLSGPHLKRLVDGLDALGEPVAVLLTSDHGEAFGEDDYYFAHGHSVGLDQIRVPLIWRSAGPARARVETAPVSLLDVAPTLLRVAGLDVPEGFGAPARANICANSTPM